MQTSNIPDDPILTMRLFNAKANNQTARFHRLLDAIGIQRRKLGKEQIANQ